MMEVYSVPWAPETSARQDHAFHVDDDDGNIGSSVDTSGTSK